MSSSGPIRSSPHATKTGTKNARRIVRIIVLTQYKSHSMDVHVARTWRMNALLGNFVAPVPAQMRAGRRWFLGSADALFQNLNVVQDEHADFVFVFVAMFYSPFSMH